MQCIPVILSGGCGTRLWPLSRQTYPKQFIEFESGKSLFTLAVERAELACDGVPPIVVSNEAYRFYVAGNLAEQHIEGKILLEPEAHNTAPAIALAALSVLEEQDALMLILPSDHLIKDKKAFAETVKQAKLSAEKGHFVTFGIVPDKPETGYGYIQQGDELPEEGSFRVARFVEKPPFQEAKKMVEDGGYLWNSGIFLVKASLYMEELARFAPEMAEKCKQSWVKKQQDGSFIRPGRDEFMQTPSESVDYAVLEKTGKASVCRFSSSWSDMGTWEAFYQNGLKDNHGNVCHGDVILDESTDCFVHSQKRLVTALDVHNLDIIETEDAILVASRDANQKIKNIVSRLKDERRPEYQHHPVSYRPWGKYEVLTVDTRFQVKRITVNPGGALSLQRHFHRAEHWVVVTGTATVTIGETQSLVTTNQSVYIPIGEKHRLCNNGKIPLVLIEVQSGDYLGEDDIERFEDIYGRDK